MTDKLAGVRKYYDNLLITDANSPIEKGKQMYNLIDLWKFAEAYRAAKMREELIMFVMNEADRCHYEDSNLKHTREEAENWIDEYLKQRNNDKD